MIKPVVTFVAALNCEVSALLNLHRAKKVCDKPFAFFEIESANSKFEILVTGIGALAMAAGVGWLGAYRPGENRVWLNIGAAGHGCKAVGQAFRVHTSLDILHERKHLPPLVASSNFASDELLSVNAPTSDYPPSGGIDMEAYAFFNAASRFSSSELIQAIKVVSDNPEQGLENLNAQVIGELMQPHTASVNQFALSLLELAKAAPCKSTLENAQRLQNLNIVLPDIRLTHSQRQQLDLLLHKLIVLNAIDDDIKTEIDSSASFKGLSSLLQSRLERCVPPIADVS